MNTFTKRLTLLAFLLRLIPVLLSVDLGIGLDDMFQYDMLARSMVAGEGFRWYAEDDLAQILRFIDFDTVVGEYDPNGLLTTFRAPLYPVFLAIIYFISGLEWRFLAARLVQAVLGALLVPLTYALGKRLFPDEERIARFAAVAVAIYPLFLMFPLALATENLFFLLVLATLVALLRAGETHATRDYLLAGGLFGLAVLNRSVIVAFLPLAMLWAWFAVKDRKGSLILLLCVVVLTLPWAARNTRLHGKPTYVETSMGFNLYLGYHPEGDGSFQSDLALDLLPILDDAERDRIGTQAALGFIRDDPGRVPYLVLRKLGHFFSLERRALTYFYANNFFGYIPTPLLVLLSLVFVLPFVVIASLAALGSPFIHWDKRRILVLLLMVGYITPHLLIMAEERFHLTLVPIFAVLAGYAWVKRKELWARALTAAARPRLALAVFLVLALFLNWGLELAADADKLAILFGPTGNQAWFSY